MYVLSKKAEENRKSKALPKLFTDGLDDESIWQQLEIQNGETVQHSLQNISSFLAVPSDTFQLNIKEMNTLEDSQQPQDDSEDGSDGSNSDEEENVDDEDENASEDDQDEEGNGYEDSEEELQDKPLEKKKKFRRTIVDDEFFKLGEMEDYLTREERRVDNDSDGDSEGVNMFSSSVDTNLVESMKYHDFYDYPENFEGDNQEDVEDEPVEEEEEAEFEEKEKSNDPKSSYELMQERLKKKIEHMENSLLDAKPWQMKGEVKGDNRPQNSLLEEVLEFDSTTRPAPIITEEVSIKLEDIIKQRIKDKAFDDVERKVKPSDIRIEYKKQLVLDQEKSKQSLAQIYEKEFISEIEKNDPNADDEEPEEPKEHKEIRAEIKDLFEKLDLLSNFYYTPRPAQPELKIITNLPTITMEEVAPIAVSDAAMLAPEEIKRKLKGDVLGAGDRTKTDKNRERRHKKVFQKNKFEKQSKGNKNLAEKVLKSRNVEKVRSTNISLR